MSSETINGLIGTLGELESRLKHFDTEARRLGELRGELKSAATGLQATGKDLQAVTAALHDGASTMRELDMAATLSRLAAIEGALDARSRELEKAINREIAALGDSLELQVSKQLADLPNQIGPTVALAFDRQFVATKTAIDSLVTDAGARHQALSELLTGGVTQILSDATGRSTAAQNAITEMRELVRETQSSQLAAMAKALADAETRNAGQAKALESALIAAANNTRRLAMLAVVVASLGAIAATISIFI